MAEAKDDVYPLASPDGSAIPYAIGDPLSLFIAAFTDAVSAVKTVDAASEIAVIIAQGADAIICVGGVALNTEDVAHTNHQYCPQDVPVSIKLTTNTFTVIAANATESGKVIVQTYRRWQSLSIDTLQTNII